MALLPNCAPNTASPEADTSGNSAGPLMPVRPNRAIEPGARILDAFRYWIFIKVQARKPLASARGGSAASFQLVLGVHLCPKLGP